MSIESGLETGVKKMWAANTVEKAAEVLRSRFGAYILALVSFVESALPVPILTDPFLIAAILADRAKAIRLILITTVFSVIGGVCAYLMAWFFFDALLELMSPGIVDEFHHIINGGQSSTMVLTLVGAVTPIPYTVVAWVVAVLKGSLMVFIAGSILGRGFRYIVVGYATYKFGPLAVSYAKRYIGITSIILLVLAAVFFWLKM
jgi:membrane protein YqaA with SNARE-associated domain